MMMFWIFLAVDMFTLGIIYAVYGGNRKYSEGMLMGVHMPESAAESEEVTAFMEKYRKRTKRFYLWNVLVGSLICLLNFWYISVFILVWSLWIVEMAAGAVALVYRTHRKLYDLKVERGWTGSSGSHILAAVDTRTSTQSGKMGVSSWWHGLFCALILMPCILPGVRTYLAVSDDGWVFLLCALAVSLTFGILHAVILRMRNKVYSENSELNLEVNRMQKNAWSWSLVGCSLMNAIAYLFVAGYMDAGTWIPAWVYVVYIILESAPAVFLIAGIFYVRYKKEQILACNENPLYIDDDVYWKNGWYSNPHDKRLIVQDWVCPWNYTTNMAKPVGKICLAGGIIVTAACLVLAVVLLMKFELTPVEMAVGQERIEITSGYSDMTICYDEIRDIELLNRLPEDDYRKINGGDTADMLVGKFKGKETGKCWLYLYTEYTPILKISTDGGPVYVNSKDEDETKKWKNEIEKNQSTETCPDAGKKNQL